MFGGVSIAGNRIDFSEIDSTRRACKLMAGNVSESVFINALDNAARYALNGNRLNMMDRRGRVTLRFKLDTNPEPGGGDTTGANRLNEKKWVLESIGQRRT